MMRQLSKQLMHGLVGDLGTHYYQDIGMPRAMHAYDGIQLDSDWKVMGGISQQPDWWRVVNNLSTYPVDNWQQKPPAGQAMP